MTRRKNSRQAETPPEAERPADDWGQGSEQGEHQEDEGNGDGDKGTEEAARQAAAEAARQADEEDEGDDGAGDGEDDPHADLAAMSTVDHDAAERDPDVEVYQGENGDGLALGSSLTPRQQVGLDAVDVTRHLEQASDRSGLTNAQTDHERDSGLDAISGTPNPGITETHGHSAPGGLGATDMSGRGVLPGALANPGPQVRGALAKLTEASNKAIAAKKKGHGYLNLRELGVNKAVMDALVEGGHVTRDERPGAAFAPETGVVYRIASHREPE